MEVVLHGKSGCNIEIVNKKFNFYLKKTSKNVNENPRHVARAQKQIDFYQNNQYRAIKTPQITKLYEGDSKKLSYMEMKYIVGKDSLSFLKEADIESVDFFIKNLIHYLNIGFTSTTEDLSSFFPSLKGKLNQVSTFNFPRKKQILDKLNQIPTSPFLQGKCHGDLTLTNMIHTKSSIFIFDFLDMYLDSPIFDLLSLRQDTHHLWSCFIYNDYNCRVVELLKHIDDHLTQEYKEIIENDWYNYLSLLNYVRMYRMYDTTSETPELNFIYNCISEYL